MYKPQIQYKISIVGAGQIGGTLALIATQKKLGDIVIVDVNQGAAQGKALDISHGTALLGRVGSIEGSGDLRDIKGSDVVVVTAGVPRKPGMSRDDLLGINVGVMETVGKAIGEFAPGAFVIVITNPVDAMTYALQKASGLPSRMVVGMAGLLDQARFAYYVSQELDIAPDDVKALVLGGHGDAMVPLVRYCSVAGIPVSELLSAEKLREIAVKTANAGGEIVELLRNGSSFLSPSLAASQMIEAYLRGTNSIISCSVKLEGQYGVDGFYLGVPAVIGSKGIERILELPLNEEERAALAESVKKVKESTDMVDYLGPSS